MFHFIITFINNYIFHPTFLTISLSLSNSIFQLVHTTDRNSRPTDNRFIRELRGGLTITNAMLEDDGKWQCEAENARGYVENARPVKLVVLGKS